MNLLNNCSHIFPTVSTHQFNLLLSLKLLEANRLATSAFSLMPFGIVPTQPLNPFYIPQNNLKLDLTMSYLHEAQNLFGSPMNVKSEPTAKVDMIIPEPVHPKVTKQPKVKEMPQMKAKAPEEVREVPHKKIYASRDSTWEKAREAFWTEENVTLLAEWAKKCRCDWKKVAKKFKNKKVTPFIVMSKYKSISQENYQQRRVRFTLTEDIQIAKLFQQYGTDWRQICACFPLRNPVMIKNRFYSYIKKKNLLETLVSMPDDAQEYPDISGLSEASTIQGSEISNELVAEEQNTTPAIQTRSQLLREDL